MQSQVLRVILVKLKNASVIPLGINQAVLQDNSCKCKQDINQPHKLQNVILKTTEIYRPAPNPCE